MKRFLIYLFLAFCTTFAFADQVNISTATLNPGGTSVQVTVSLAGTRLYTSYNMDITLPEGWSVEYRNDAPRVTMVKNGGIYPSTYDEDEETYSYTHTVSCSYGEVGNRVLRVACISTSNETFIATSGNLFRVYLQASPFAKPGTPNINITATDFAIYDSQSGMVTPYHFDDAVSNAVAVSTSATVPLVISSSLWSTCVLPCVAAIPTGVTAYSCQSVEDDAVYLSPVNSLEAFTPYILYSEAAFSQNISGTIDATNYPANSYVDDAANILHGALADQIVSVGYVLQQSPEEAEPKFYDMDGVDFTIPAGKCWMTVPAGNNSPSIRLVIGAPTDLKTSLYQQNGQTYNILGQPVSKPTSGQIYILNGQKFLQK